MKNDVAGTALGRHRLSPRWTVALAVITLAGACLCLLHLGQKSYWWDEIVTIRLARMPLPDFLHTLWGFEGNMSLYYLLVRGWIHFGDSEAWLRLLSAIFAIAAIPAIYGVGKIVSGRTTGLLAALLLAVNAAHVAYAQEARGYSLLVLLCTLSLWFFLRIGDSGKGNAAGYVIVSALAVYVHFFAVFFLFAQWISLLWLRQNSERWKKFILPVSLTLVFISPALYYMAFRRSGQLAWVPATKPSDLLQLLYFLVADLGTFRKALALIYVLCCGLALRGAFSGRVPSESRWRILVLALCAALPGAILFPVSFLYPLFLPRYFLMCLPPLVVLAAAGLANIRPSSLRLAVCVVIVGLSGFSLHRYYTRPKDDWRGLTVYLLHHVEPGDLIVGCPPGAEWPVQYYAGKLGTDSSPKPAYLEPEPLIKDVDSHRATGKPLPSVRFWMVDWGGSPDSKRLPSAVAPDYQQVEEKKFPNSLTVELYENAGK
jgi:mannosyltransferase